MIQKGAIDVHVGNSVLDWRKSRQEIDKSHLRQVEEDEQKAWSYHSPGVERELAGIIIPVDTI